MINEKWLKAAGIRALKTICQTALATIGTAAVMSQVNGDRKSTRLNSSHSA